MSTDVSGAALRGLGLPYALTPAHIWDDKATFTQQGPTNGEAVPQGSYTLALEASGTQSASKELRVQVNQGGPVQPGGAEVIYQYEGDTDWRGCDVQQTSAWQVIRTTAAAATSALADPDACTFYDTDRTDRIAVVYQRQSVGPTAYNVECAVYDPADGTWTSSTVYTQSTSPTDGFHPTVTYNRRDGHLYCAHWIYDTSAETAQVRVHRSLDGSTWTVVSSYALEDGLDISGTAGSAADGYEAGRLRMAFSGGQCLLVAHVIANDTDTSAEPRDQLAQWFSVSRASRFTLAADIARIEFTGGDTNVFAFHSVMEIDGVLTVFWPSTIAQLPTANYMYRLALPSASSSILSRVTTAFDASAGVFSFAESGSGTAGRVFDYDTTTNQVVTDGDGSVWVDEDGTIQGAWRLSTSSATNEGGVFLARSTDSGLNWKYTGNGDADGTDAAGALVVYTGDSATYLSDFVGVSHRGRQVLIGLNTTDVTSSVTLSATFLGGPSTVTLPAPISYPRTHQRSSWTESYLPLELPANISSLTTTGAGTDAITSTGLLNRSTSSQTKYTTMTLTSTVAQGVAARYALTVNSGGALTGNQCALNLRSADGGADYDVYIRFSTSSFRMWDDNAASQIGTDKSTVSPDEGIDVLAAIANGELSVWFRALDSKSDREWTAAIQGHSLTAGAGSTDIVRWGAIATGTADFDIHEAHAMSGASANGALGGGFTNPDDLFGRTLSRRGQTIGIDDGVRVVAVDGSAMEGDTFNIDTAYEHPIERILYRESPSPRSMWRSVAVTSGNTPEQLIPFVLNTDATLGSEEQGFGSTLLYATFQGVNWSAGSIDRWDTGTNAWVTVATLNNAISTAFSLTRRGNELIVPSLPTTSSGRYFRENECAGWTVMMGTTFRRLTGNSAGTLASNIDGAKPVFFLADIDGSEPTTTTITLIPDKFCVTFHTDGETGGGWALRIDAQKTTELDLRCGHFSMGRVFAFGTQYGRGRVIAYESGDLTESTISGVQRARRAGPGGRTVRIAWPEPIDTSQLQGATTDPDYITSTNVAGNLPVAAQKDPPLSLRGVLEQVGARDAITYLPCVPTPAGTTHYRFSDAFMLGTIASAVQVESTLGDECDPTTGELFRVATVVIEEVR